MTDKAGKKKASDDKILSDSEDTLPDFECETCKVQFTDAKAYENHMLGKKHSKKVTEMKLKAKNKISDDKNDESENDDSDESEELHCDVCDKNFTAYVSYVAHVKGSAHAKNLKKQKLKKQLADRPEVVEKEDIGKGSDDDDTDDDDILPKAYARCTSCQKEFFGPESFKQHVQSAAHLKKVKQTRMLQNLKQEGGNLDDNDEDVYGKCEVCVKSFSGVVPYKIHMQSNVHKKNLEKKKIAEEIKGFCANTDFEEGYVCKECNKKFTDPLAFKNHLKNNSHERMKAKKALEDFLKAYPEIVYVTTPYDEKVSEDEKSSEDEDNSLYYLICKICQVSFAGPESAQDHVKSKKHMNVKREKKMRKLMKEQQKNSSEKSAVNTNGSKPSSELTPSASKQTNGSKSVPDQSADDFEVL